MSTIEQASTAPPRTVFHLGGASAVWALAAMLAAAVGVVWFLAGAQLAGPVDPPLPLPWWAVAAAFFLSEAFVVHLHFRREAHTLSFSELPLVLGLFLAGPAALLVGQIVGAFLALVCVRRQRPVKAAFNLAQFAFATTVALLVFHALAGSDSRGVVAWLAAFAAALCSSGAGVALVAGAIWLAEGRSTLRELRRVAAMSTLGTAANASVALAAVELLDAGHAAALLLLAPLVTCVVAFRAHTAERARREHLEFLYDSMRSAQAAPDMRSAAAELLAAARQMLRAEYAQLLLLPSPGDEEALRATDSATGGRSIERVRLSLEEQRAIDLTHEAGPLLVAARRTSHELDAFLAERGLRDAMLAAVRGETRPLGVLLVGDRSGDVSDFAPPDLRLFETFANHAGILLENDRLEQALARLTELQEQLRHQAYHDALTQLPNRALFTERIVETLARPGARPVVLFIDLDDFKLINDSLGHAAGDELLTLVASRVATCVRPGDVPARLGGDEFAVLLTDASISAGEQVAGRVIAALKDPFVLGGRRVAVRASIGIASAGEGASSADELLRNADVAMYAAKGSAKRRYALYQPAMQATIRERHELVLALEQGIENGEIRAYFQPVVGLADGRTIAFEALARWHRPGHGVVSPAQFIDLAESAGLLPRIRRMILAQACDAAADWPVAEGGEPLSVAVNLSLSDLRDPALVDEVSTALADAGFEAGRLILEVTESGAVREGTETIAALRRLRELGVRLALDDFGTGYSSLGHLSELPVDMLKIPKTFIDRLGHGAPERAIAATILGLCASLGLECVAEGIESEAQAQELRRLGCSVGQGYLYSHPVEAAEVSRRLRGAEAPVVATV